MYTTYKQTESILFHLEPLFAVVVGAYKSYCISKNGGTVKVSYVHICMSHECLGNIYIRRVSTGQRLCLTHLKMYF